MMGCILLIFAWKSSLINFDFAQLFDLTIIWHALLTVNSSNLLISQI